MKMVYKTVMGQYDGYEGSMYGTVAKPVGYNSLSFNLIAKYPVGDVYHIVLDSHYEINVTSSH